MDGFLSCGAAGMVEDDDERASQWLCVNSCVSADGRLARAGSSGGCHNCFKLCQTCHLVFYVTFVCKDAKLFLRVKDKIC